jgi:hypothetical protein
MIRTIHTDIGIISYTPNDTGKGNLVDMSHFIEKGNSISDGYHTFDELYNHRHSLFIALCRALYSHNELCIASGQKNTVGQIWRSKSHSDGTMFEGMFIVGIGTEPGSQITYHLDNPFWSEFDDCAVTLDIAPEWDGHSANDVVRRLSSLLKTIHA